MAISIEVAYLDEQRPRYFAELDVPSGKWSVYVHGEDRRDQLAADALPVEQILDGYARFTMFLEDVVVVSPTCHEIVSFDTMTGKRMADSWPLEHIIAAVSLALLGDEIDRSAEYYEIVEPMFERWAKECRFIP